MSDAPVASDAPAAADAPDPRSTSGVQLPGEAGSRPLPLTGWLGVVAGLGLLLVRWKFGPWFEGWTISQQVAFTLIALVSLAYGLWRVLFVRDETGVVRYDRQQVHLPTPGLFYLTIMGALFVGSLLSRSNMLMLVFACMAGPFVLNGWVMFTMLKRNKVRRRLPRAVMAGERVSVELTLRNGKRLVASRLMTVHDHVRGAGEQLDAGILFVHVPAGTERSASYRLTLNRRGRYRLGPVRLATRFPLGLIERSLLLDVHDEVLVYPRVGTLTPRWRREQSQTAELVDPLHTRRGVFDDEFHGLREYRAGDNARAIHWRTTARRNQPMVREFHQSRDRHVCLLLDLHLPPGARQADRDRVELAVSFAATVGLDQLRRRRESFLRLTVGGRETKAWEGRLQSAATDELLSLLASAEGSERVDLVALAEAAARTGPQTTTYLVTTRPSVQHLRNDSRLRSSSREFGGDVRILLADPREMAAYFRWQ